MKKLMISAALFAVLGANVGAVAADVRDGVKGSSKTSVETTGKSGVYNLVYRNAVASAVKVTITDEAGMVVLVDQIDAEGAFLRPYNFMGLPAGSYTLTILDRNGKTILPIIHSNAGIQANPIVQIKPVEGKKYELTLLGNNAEALRVNIYDASRSLVYSEQIERKGSFSRVYNLNKLHANNFTFEVVSPNGLVSKKEL